ncbi:hypothetical protein ABBQ38_012271 [Trebouxia sp. C0009 RCD-2024]
MAVTGLLLQWGCLEGVNPDLPAALAALDAGFTNHQQESFVTETALFAFAYTNMQVQGKEVKAGCHAHLKPGLLAAPPGPARFVIGTSWLVDPLCSLALQPVQGKLAIEQA